MLPRRLTLLSTAAGLAITGCAGADGSDRGLVRENVVEPGITAIDESRALACSADATAFRTALDAYELFEGVPAPNEAALVDEGLLRSESELWDVVDGRLVPADPACGDVPATLPISEIVTEADAAPQSVDDYLASFTTDDVTSFGGPDCARQLAVVFAGAAAFTASEGAEPDTIEQVAAAGYFDEAVTSWQLVDGVLRPTDGSGCEDFVAADQ